MKHIYAHDYVNREACNKRQEEHKRDKHHAICPYYLSFEGKCFGFCDLESKDACGDCVNFIPRRDENNLPMDKKYCGHCFHSIGVIVPSMKTSCPFYIRKQDSDMFADDWIEKRVKELCDFDKHSPEARKYRVQARKEWLADHPIQQNRIKN